MANAVKNIASRQGSRRRTPFRWNSWSGAAVAVLAGMTAATSMNRRQESEELLSMAEARVARAEGEVSRMKESLTTEVKVVASELTSLRKSEDVEKRLRDWISDVVEGSSSRIGDDEDAKPALV